MCIELYYFLNIDTFNKRISLKFQMKRTVFIINDKFSSIIEEKLIQI